MDQTEVQRLSQKMEYLEFVKELETTVIRLESENKELLRKVGSLESENKELLRKVGGLNALVPKDDCSLWCR